MQKQTAYGQYTLCCNNTHTIKNLNNPSFLLYIYKEKYATSKVATKTQLTLFNKILLQHIQPKHTFTKKIQLKYEKVFRKSILQKRRC